MEAKDGQGRVESDGPRRAPLPQARGSRPPEAQPLDRANLEPRLSIETHGESWISELLNHGRSPETAKTYRYALKYFRLWLESLGLTVEGLTRGDVEQWLQDMRIGKLSAATMRQRLMVVRDFYRWLVASDLLTKDPMFRLGRIKAPRHLPHILRADDIEKLLLTAGSSRERAIVEILYASGCRRAELLGLRLQDLDLDGGLVRIMGKGSKPRLGLLNPKAVKAVRDWLVDREFAARRLRYPTDRLIIGRCGPLSKGQLGAVVSGIGKRAGLAWSLHPHSFRHAMATAMIDGGARIEEVRAILGHESIATTQIYVQLSMERLREVYRRSHPRG